MVVEGMVIATGADTGPPPRESEVRCDGEPACRSSFVASRVGCVEFADTQVN
jgi:hypothetical protein